MQKVLTVRSDEDRLDNHDRARRMSHDPMMRSHDLAFLSPV